MSVVPLDSPARRAAVLSEIHPPGTPCIYWPGPVGMWEAGDGPRLRRISSNFGIANCGGIVVHLDGEVGYVAASHVAPLSDADIERTAGR